jgi:hypothetical protein
MIKRRRRPRKGELRLVARVVAAIPSRMEDPMCWEMDYHWFAEQHKAQEKQKQHEKQRAEAIDKLLRQANKEADTADETLPVKETIPAK